VAVQLNLDKVIVNKSLNFGPSFGFSA